MSFGSVNIGIVSGENVKEKKKKKDSKEQFSDE
jgi:hypothetical protein